MENVYLYSHIAVDSSDCAVPVEPMGSVSFPGRDGGVSIHVYRAKGLVEFVGNWYSVPIVKIGSMPYECSYTGSYDPSYRDVKLYLSGARTLHFYTGLEDLLGTMGFDEKYRPVLNIQLACLGIPDRGLEEDWKTLQKGGCAPRRTGYSGHR